MISTKLIKLKWKKKTDKWRSVTFVVIKYAIKTLRYTIFCNISYVMEETSIEPTNVNIKYMIFRYKIDAKDIKYIKISKIG